MRFPLVSCIMPTTEARAEYRKSAEECFRSQTYPNLELVVVDGPGLIGGKRNTACERSTGAIIVHFDDDDWSAPGRVMDQVARLMSTDVDLIGYYEMDFVDEIRNVRWKYCNPGYALGTSFCYWKSFWELNPFPDIKIGSDNKFQRAGKLLAVPSNGLMWARIHPGNTSGKRPGGGHWTKYE